MKSSGGPVTVGVDVGTTSVKALAVDENGQVDFFDDIYHYDKQLEDVLAKGMPYPSQQQHVDPKTKFGDTT